MSTYDIIKIIVGLIVLFIVGMYVGGLVYQATGCCECDCEEDLSCYTQIDFPCREDVRAFNADETEEYEVRCTDYGVTYVKLPKTEGNISIIMYYDWKGDL